MDCNLKILLNLLILVLLCSKGFSQTTQASSGEEPICTTNDDCGTHGVCEVDMCVCDPLWIGTYCNESEYCNGTNPCNGVGNCTASEEGDRKFECKCEEGYSGLDCGLTVCVAEEVVGPFGTNTSFPTTIQQETAFANDRCEEDGFFNGKPIGSRKCGESSMWADVVWINCNAASLGELDESEQIEAIHVVTSDPETVTPKDAEDVIKAYENLTSTATSAYNVTSLTSTLNNLLQVTQEQTIATVANSAESLRQGLTKMGAQVDLEMMPDGQEFYENVETDVAMSVISKESSSLLRETGMQDYAISLSQPLQQEDGLKGVVFDYSTGEEMLQNAALYARTNSAKKMIVQLFADEILFSPESGDPKVESAIMRVESEGSSGYQMKFNLFQYYRDLDPSGDDTASNRIFSCESWSTKGWSNSTCILAGVSDLNLYNYLTCNCTNPGYYAILSRMQADPEDPAVDPVNQGLSDGEIAGIVIGSIAGAALLIGLGVYCVKRNKKKKSEVIPLKQTKAGSEGSHENHYITESRRSSSDIGKP